MANRTIDYSEGLFNLFIKQKHVKKETKWL